MRYLPKSPEERQQMLREIGCDSVEQLFASIPPEVRFQGNLALGPGQSEPEILDYFRKRAAENARDVTSFLGAGVYDHYRPAVLDALISRSEFYTAYTPYQPEISQGTLQAIFEFQTLMCQLTGMDVANASLYDGSTALPESVMMAIRANGRKRVLVARSVHPEYRQVLKTYLQHQSLALDEVPYAESGQADAGALGERLGPDVAAVAVQSPNFFGIVEDIPSLAERAHSLGALLIVMIAEPVSLGILRPPVEADIVAGEGQSLGVPLSYGGPYVGFLAAREKYLRSMPGRLVGQTVDSEGNRGFCLTLATREQHIRREKATSNICTNQALCALMVTIFLSVYGKQGLRELAIQNLSKARYAAERFHQAGARLRFRAPYFNELVVTGLGSHRQWKERLLEQKIIGGLDLGRFYPELDGDVLCCFTETAAREKIDQLVKIATE
ncbi:MAG: glycine dehydrogenase (aminomethyl-transferring) [Acidobacteria bacterium RIFCSPLOWO2_12_FULL_60_22]|nr:MAG: glycine dehydrogenase (aminomethyl-transferring) [Acidobacteria bacterium RIFCSPLOWO2_12_FULL_60_22]